jgi:hypothetical protein
MIQDSSNENLLCSKAKDCHFHRSLYICFFLRVAPKETVLSTLLRKSYNKKQEIEYVKTC